MAKLFSQYLCSLVFSNPRYQSLPSPCSMPKLHSHVARTPALGVGPSGSHMHIDLHHLVRCTCRTYHHSEAVGLLVEESSMQSDGLRKHLIARLRNCHRSRRVQHRGWDCQFLRVDQVNLSYGCDAKPTTWDAWVVSPLCGH